MAGKDQVIILTISGLLGTIHKNSKGSFPLFSYQWWAFAGIYTTSFFWTSNKFEVLKNSTNKNGVGEFIIINYAKVN